MDIRIFFRGTRSIIEVQNEGLYTKIMEVKFSNHNGKPDFMRRRPRMVKHKVHDMNMRSYLDTFRKLLADNFPTPEKFKEVYHDSLALASTKKVTS